MWEDETSDFGEQAHANGEANGESGLDGSGALDLGHSELMYGTFMDAATAWNGQFELNHLQQHHQYLNHQHSIQYSTDQLSEQDEAARAAAVLDNSAIHAGIIEDSTGEGKAFYNQGDASAAAAMAAAAVTGTNQAHGQLQQSHQHQQQQQCLLPSVPELASWWGSNAASACQSVTTSGESGGAASSSGWTPNVVNQQQHQQQHQQQSMQPSETVSEREFIIVRKAKASIGWDGSPVADASVVYECRICGRQCRWRSSISVHVRTHTGRKPYQCRVCHHRFADSSTRKKHEKKTHGCIIPGNKKAAGFDGQMPPAAGDASGLQLHHQPIANLTCHLCFAILPNETELTKHLYEYHNHLSPVDFGAPVGSAAAGAAAADDIPVLVTPVRRVPARHPEPPPIYHQHHHVVAGGGVWPEFDDACGQAPQLAQPQSQLMQQHNQQSMGIPLPAVQRSARDRDIDQNIGAVDQKPDHDHLQQDGQLQLPHQSQHADQQQRQPEDGQDLLDPYEIGSLGRELHGIESILDDGRLGSYNQHLDFDRLDW